MKQKEYKISEQNFKTLQEISQALTVVETRGDSTMLIANIRQGLINLLQQVVEIPAERKD